MYQLNQEGQAILARARDLAEKEICPHAQETDSQGLFPARSIEALGKAGLMGLTVSSELGGMGQGPRVACAVLEEIAQRCASTAMVYLMHLCGLACYNAAPETAGDYLKAAAKGKHLSTLAFSERGSRSHFWTPVSRARQENGHARITAEKSWVTSAGHADGYVVSTQKPDAKDPKESTLYLVLRDDKGLKTAGPWHGLGLRGNASSPMTLEGVAVGPQRALSAEGKGLDVMLEIVLPIFQLGQAAIACGISEAAVGATQKHLTSHRFEHLGSSLADLPNLRSRLAQMRIETDRSRAHLLSAIDSIERPGPMTQLMILEVKASASEGAVQVTETGMRACGGAAFSKHLGLERNFRDARASIIMSPTTDQLQEFIGRALCGMEVL